MGQIFVWVLRSVKLPEGSGLRAAGFSLVEMAVALSIVGLLAAGASKGYIFLKQARLQRMVQQMTSVRMAVSFFRDRYDAMPGDWTGTDSDDMRGGNGNGILDGDYLTPWSEKNLFWYHLQKTGSAEDLAFVSSLGHRPEDGVFVPKGALRGGLFAVTEPQGVGSGLWIVVADANNANRGVLTPAEAQFLDQKLSNGNPLLGGVQSRDDSSAQQNCVQDGRYAIRNKRARCLVYVRLD